MKLRLSFFVFFFFVNCQTSWYRRLPDGNSLVGKEFIGVWRKQSKPRSGINSSWHKNKWIEKIEFRKDNSFTKLYEAEDYIGKTLVEMKVEGTGVYESKGNWILLKTENLTRVEKHERLVIKNSSKDKESSLLYYYYKDENIIIPMIYDMGYNEQEFGVKDGVSIPYTENANFFHYIKIYAFKEFQSHAYYPEN